MANTLISAGYSSTLSKKVGDSLWHYERIIKPVLVSGLLTRNSVFQHITGRLRPLRPVTNILCSHQNKSAHSKHSIPPKFKQTKSLVECYVAIKSCFQKVLSFYFLITNIEDSRMFNYRVFNVETTSHTHWSNLLLY